MSQTEPVKSPTIGLVMPISVTHFARKLYDMLEDVQNQAVVCWGPRRDCFMVNDTTEFSKTVLPRTFHHSNFLSFVRQLNKYGFHKVKQTGYNQGEQTCTFRHEHFHGDRPGSFYKIKRKLPIIKSSTGTGHGSHSSTSSHPYESSNPSSASFSSNSTPSHIPLRRNGFFPLFENMTEIEQLREENKDLDGRTQNLESNQDVMQADLNNMGRMVAQHHGQVEFLIKFFGSINVSSTTTFAQQTHTSILPSMSMWPSSSTDTGSLSTTTGDTRTSKPLVDQPQACLSAIDEHPFIPRTMEPHLPQRHRRRTLNDRLSQKNSSPPAARSSKYGYAQDIVAFAPTHSSGSIPVFGQLGQVTNSSLMLERGINRRMAAEQPRHLEPEKDSKLWSGPDFVEIGQYDFSGWLAESESSEHFPSPRASLEIPQDAEMAESLQELENQPQYVRAALNRGLKQTREHESLHQSDRRGEDIGMHPILDADEMA